MLRVPAACTALQPEPNCACCSSLPQVLHYKIDSMQERLAFLRGCGLDGGQVAAAVARFPGVFSLNVEANMAPKWRYLADFICLAPPQDPVATLCAYPAFFSLSLTNRRAGAVL